MKHETYNINNRFGFSIIEVMAAITIIVIGLVGVLSLVTQNIQVSSINKNELIASQLAQEGLELVRNIRDENWLIYGNDGNDWKCGPACTPGSVNNIIQDGHYTIAYSGDNILINPLVDSIDDNGAKLVRLATDFYGHGWGLATIFSRLINVDDYGDYIEVKSTVRWTERGGIKNYIASTILYNWR